MISTSFDVSCSNCHAQRIWAKKQPSGIELFAVPGLDLTTLKQRGAALGNWPEGAKGMIPPFMVFLLMENDPRFAPAWKLFSGLDSLDLSKASEEMIQAVVDVAWSIKRLLLQLQTEGLERLLEPLWNQIPGHRPTPSRVAAMKGLLSAEVVRTAIGQWFPRLSEEVQQSESVAALQSTLLSNAPSERVVWEQNKGWFQEEFSLFYIPAGHGDLFMRTWLDYLVPWSTSAAQDLFGQLSDEGTPGQCGKCHQAITEEGKPPHMAWQSKRILPGEKTFNRYSHASHLTPMDEKGCLTCHRLSEGEEEEEITSGFEAMRKEICASCHTSGEAGEECKLCHNFHVGIFPFLKGVKAPILVDKGD